MVNKLKLGKLEKVDIRKLWKHEQYDFSEWLSKEENIEILSDEIGLILTDIKKSLLIFTAAIWLQKMKQLGLN